MEFYLHRGMAARRARSAQLLGSRTVLPLGVRSCIVHRVYQLTLSGGVAFARQLHVLELPQPAARYHTHLRTPLCIHIRASLNR